MKAFFQYFYETDFPFTFEWPKKKAPTPPPAPAPAPAPEAPHQGNIFTSLGRSVGKAGAKMSEETEKLIPQVGAGLNRAAQFSSNVVSSVGKTISKLGQEDPAMLGLGAAGLAGLYLWRRQQRQRMGY